MSLLAAIALASAPPAAPAPEPSETVDWDAEFGVEKKAPDPRTGELPVDPYVQSNANSGAASFAGTALADAFGGQPGIRSIVDRLVALSTADPRINAIFERQDLVRLHRTLFEQFCFILNAGCTYTGRDMAAAHKDLGATRADLNALVENLQRSMRELRVPFAAQNRLLARLAPMERDVVTR